MIGLTKSKVEKRLSEIGPEVDVQTISIVSSTGMTSSPTTTGDTPPEDLSLLIVKTAKDAERVASRSRLAKSALAVYEKMFNDPAIEFVEKDAAKPRLAYWQKVAAQDLVRIGPKWLTKDSVLAVRDEERRLVKEATEDLIARRVADADKKFSEARSIDPDGIMVDFQVGLLQAVQQHDPNRSAASFEKCVIKRKSRTDLSVEEKANLAAALNNLAVSNLHIRKTSEAQLDWAKAIDVAKPSPEIMQNLGRTFTGTKSGGIFFEGEERKKWDSLQAKAESLANQRGYNQSRGFLLMSFQKEGDEKTIGLIFAESPAGTMEIRTCLKCLGSGLLTCGNCTLGTIPGIKDEVIAGPGGNQIVIHKKIRLPCPKCKGKGKVQCNGCTDGTDPALGNGKKTPN